MKLVASDLMCTSVPAPKSWKMDGREGVTYKVDISDGESTISLPCGTIEVYQRFVPFKRYNVAIDLVQTNYEGRKGVKAFVVGAEQSKNKD